MKGDFSRLTFDPANHFSRVLLQQGRVTVDADPNEQASILLHYLRTLARDLMGPCGGPPDALGFVPSLDSSSPPVLTLGAGRYYVDGILCENEEDCVYGGQPDFTSAADDPLLDWLAKPDQKQAFWLYLDVWERHITYIEDDRIREVALGGPDTCSRAKVIWQVKALALDPPPVDGGHPTPEGCTGPLAHLPGPSAARLAAGLNPGPQSKDPCVISPDARYRGLENQLYRVEIQRAGTAGGKHGATFKWSRDNGSVASRWLGTDGNDLMVGSGRGFKAGAWVELTDDALDLAGTPGVLVLVISVDGNRLTIDPASVPTGASTAWSEELRYPKVRRWDQTENDDIALEDGGVPIVESPVDDPTWIDLEDGLRVQFAASADAGTPVQYRSSDYWLIPARVATGDIEWPHTPDASAPGGFTPDLLPPRGIQHHYAPVGWLTANNDNTPIASPCLCKLNPISPCDRPVAALKGVVPRRLAKGARKVPTPAAPVPVKPKPRKPK
jgi:hypothetical protein